MADLKQLIRAFALALLLGVVPACAGATAPAGSAGEGIVRQITKAPVVPDGDVAGSPSDIVIDLNTSLDPNVPGRTLLKGKSIKVTFPDAFKRTGIPVQQFTAGKCPQQCAAVALLQGWPQHPFPFPKYDLSLEGTQTIVITANEDLKANPPLDPGLKQIHLLASSHTNPAAGSYQIKVSAETGPNGAVETGSGTLTILAAIRPSLNPASALSQPPGLNAIYQQAALGQETGRPFDFLLWGADGKPLTGVSVAPADTTKFAKYTGGLLKQGDKVVGGIIGSAPQGATGQRAFSDEASKEVKAPATGVLTALLRVRFVVGSVAGEYVPTFELIDGNAWQMHVTAK
ncbi:MAG: hypothetical protein NVS9B11_18960 [Candidatus Dormibacteraceae bacterium]